MIDKNAEKQLTGPFRSEANADNYYTVHQDGTTVLLSSDALFAGTVTAVVSEEEQKAAEPSLEEEVSARFQKMRDEEGLVAVGMTLAP